MPPWKDVVQKYFLTAFILDTDKGGGAFISTSKLFSGQHPFYGENNVFCKVRNVPRCPEGVTSVPTQEYTPVYS